jgi:hypothetical protein
MTILERFEAVQHPMLRARLLANYNPTLGALAGNICNDRTALMSGFLWYGTKEGNDYWEELNRHMTNKNTLDEGYADLIKEKGYA